MEKEVSTPAQKNEMALSEKGSVKKEKKDAKENTIIGSNLTNGSAHSSPKGENMPSDVGNAKIEDVLETKNINKDEDDDRMEANTQGSSNLIPQHNEVPLSISSLDNDYRGSQNDLPEDINMETSETKDNSSLNSTSDSERQPNKENIDEPETAEKAEGNTSNERLSSKPDTIVNTSENNLVPPESEVEIENDRKTDSFTTLSNSSSKDIESQQQQLPVKQQESSHNQCEQPSHQTTEKQNSNNELDNQDFNSTQHSSDELSSINEVNRCDKTNAIAGESNTTNHQNSKSNDEMSEHNIQSLDKVGNVDDVNSRLISEAEHEGKGQASREKGIHEDGKEEKNESLSALADPSDKEEESSSSVCNQSTNQTPVDNENSEQGSNQNAKVQADSWNSSTFDSTKEDKTDLNDKEDESIKLESGYIDNRTNNSDFVSNRVDTNLNPSAMNLNEYENLTPTQQQSMQQQNNKVYTSSNHNSKSNSPTSHHPSHHGNQHQASSFNQTSSNIASSSPSTLDSSNRIKDDPYNFSEEEDVFSPQLPSRQFSSSNANFESSDPAMERLKAENRSSGEFDDFDDEMGEHDGETEDPDRLVIADENLGIDPSNRLNYESNQAEGAQLPGTFHNSNGSSTSSNDSKAKGEKPPRKKHNRFNGMSEEEVAKKILPDLITPDLDILIIGINPGMYAAFKGHHYAGPGNHFWKCMFLSGLLPRPMTAEDDRKLLDHGIGFTNIVERTTKGTANLTRREIEEGNVSLTQKIQHYRPKIVVFNGKGIYEIFSNKKEFYFGKQPDKIDGSETHVWVMPNSSARCAQLPRAVDKVPFYAGLKKFRDYLRGTVPSIEENEMVFKDVKLQNFNEKQPFKKDFRDDAGTDSSGTPPGMNSDYDPMGSSNENNEGYAAHMLSHSGGGNGQTESRVDPLTGKKKRGRPPKPRPDGSVPAPKRRMVDEHGVPLPKGSNPIDPLTGKKKRGRPKKGESTASQGSGNNDQDLKFSGYPGSKRDSIDSNESYSGCSGDQIQPHPANQKPSTDSASSAPRDGEGNNPPMPLPPFSPNFGRPSSGMEMQQSTENNKNNESGVVGDHPQSSAMSGVAMNQHHPNNLQQHQPHHAQSLEHSQKDSNSQQSMSSSHNVTDMHSSSSVPGNEYDRSGGVAARLHGNVDTNNVRSHSSHSGHGEYHPHQSQQQQQSLNEQHHLQQQHKQQHSQQQHSQQQHPYGSQYPYPGYPQISSRSDSTGSLTPTAPAGVHHPQHYSPDPAVANGANHAGSNAGYTGSQHHQHPSHAGAARADQASNEQSFSNNPRHQPQSQHPQQQAHPQQHSNVGKTGGRRNEDVTTKSITGLESLVDQIPALENDSGVYSANSGGGSQPDTPRSSMGQYSPATAAGYHPSSFHAPGFPVPAVASAGAAPAAAVAATGVGSNPNHFSAGPSTSDSSNYTPTNDSTNFSASSGSVASSQTPTNFSVSSLMHNNSSDAGGTSNTNPTPAASEAVSQANAANAGLGGSSLMPPPAPFSSDSFSVSSLTSSYAAAAAQAHDMAKYSAGLAANNPYMSSAFGSSAFGAGSSLGPSAAAYNSFMSGSMGGAMNAAHMGAAAMGMGAMGAYYGQYSQAQAAAANAAYGQAAAATAGFPHAAAASAYSHGLHMPNPGYPYSPYGQSPYPQSPYF